MNESHNEVGSRRDIRISRTKLVVGIILVVVAVAIVWFISTISTYKYGMSETSQAIPNFGDDQGYSQPQSDITDTRQFMKTSYSASIKTRGVHQVVTDINNIVKGADGRVDSMESSDMSGYISFVVPKSGFDAFRDQVQALTHARLYSENVSSVNQLSTKQNIESQQNSATSTLASLKAQESSLSQKHAQTVATINSGLYQTRAQLSNIQSNISNVTPSTDPSVVASWRDQEIALANQESAQMQRLNTENSSYASQKQSLDNQISYQNSRLADLGAQDTRFANDIETVNGSISVSWVSVWQLITIYSPISPYWIILIIVILVWMYLNHRKITPKFVIG